MVTKNDITIVKILKIVIYSSLGTNYYVTNISWAPTMCWLLEMEIE